MNLLRHAKLEWKSEIITHSADPWNYRNRVRMKVHAGPDFALGYHPLASHDLLPVKQCPISSPAINRVIQSLWELGEGGKVPAGISEIEFFADHADAKLVLEIYTAEGPPGMQEFGGALMVLRPEIRGVAFFTQGAGAAAFIANGLEFRGTLCDSA